MELLSRFAPPPRLEMRDLDASPEDLDLSEFLVDEIPELSVDDDEDDEGDLEELWVA